MMPISHAPDLEASTEPARGGIDVSKDVHTDDKIEFQECVRLVTAEDGM